MSVICSIEFNGGELDKLLQRMTTELPAETQIATTRANIRIKESVVTLAKSFAPISPTKAQYVASLKGRVVAVKGRDGLVSRKKVKFTTRTDFHPGQLTNSITGESTTNLVRVFVPANSRAGKYSRFIHFGKFNRGVGTIAKGPQADRMFIYRAIDFLRKTGQLLRIYRDELETALRNKGVI